jgi:hypothetical protein
MNFPDPHLEHELRLAVTGRAAAIWLAVIVGVGGAGIASATDSDAVGYVGVFLGGGGGLVAAFAFDQRVDTLRSRLAQLYSQPLPPNPPADSTILAAVIGIAVAIVGTFTALAA